MMRPPAAATEPCRTGEMSYCAGPRCGAAPAHVAISAALSITKSAEAFIVGFLILDALLFPATFADSGDCTCHVNHEGHEAHEETRRVTSIIRITNVFDWPRTHKH